MRRVVSLFLRHWSTDRLRRKGSTQPLNGAIGRPLVTAVADHGRRIVASTDVAASALGITTGMTVTKARSYAPDLEVVDADFDADLEGLRQLAFWAGRRYSPIVAVAQPDGLWLDITGCAQLFDTERALVNDLHRRVAAFGLSMQIAVADTAGCAHAVARHVPAGRPVIIEPGDHRKAIALLPVSALRLDQQAVIGLRKLGFERIEQLIATHRAPLAKRFGRDLHRRLDQALGFVPEPIEPIFPYALPSCRRGFMEPILTAEAFGCVIGDLVSDLVAQLVTMGRGARKLDCFFYRVDGHVQAIRVGTAKPSRDRGHLAKLLTAKMETIDPGLGIEAMLLVAPLVDVMGPEGAGLEGMMRSGRREPDLSALVDALANRFGGRRLFRNAPNPSAMPERTVVRGSPIGVAGGATWDEDLPRPCRMLSPPEPIDVTAMMPDHPPAMFVWRRKRFRVTQADGPERLHGEWWREQGVEADRPMMVRDYYQVETQSGGRYWVFRLGDGENPATGPMRWFIHGAFA
tara:strand:+ start:36380 stop:37933 length:1554 start_codon:yes stop_codon:yes gene_type:complete